MYLILNTIKDYSYIKMKKHNQTQITNFINNIACMSIMYR